jgi:apolipoprotein N-acyltransferase
MKNQMDEKRYYGAALLSGLILILAYPPFDLGFIAWVALIPLMFCVSELPPAKAFTAGFLFALPFNLYLNLYLSQVLLPHLGFTLGLIAMIALIIYLNLFYGLFALTASFVYRQGKPWFTMPAIPALWLMVEYLRSLGFMAYNVGYLGFSQWPYPAILSVAALYGYWGLPFILVYFQTTLTMLWRRELKTGLFIGSLAFLLLLIFAGLLVPGLFATKQDDQTLNTVLVQGNSTPEEILTGGKELIARRYLDQTQQALAINPEVDLVVWPETVVDLDFRQQIKHYQLLIAPEDNFKLPLLYGARTRCPEQLFNTILLYQPGEKEIPLYHKQRLVPFVEFFPAEQYLNRLLSLNMLLGSYSPGSELTIFELDAVRLAGVICFESYFGDHTRLLAKAGAEHLFVLTNDNWFGSSIGLEQHAQVGAIRAAETGIGVTQVANSGITISFDYLGRELFRTGKQVEDTVVVSLPLAHRQTVYQLWGDYFPALWALFLAVGLVSIYCSKHSADKSRNKSLVKFSGHR